MSISEECGPELQASECSPPSGPPRISVFKRVYKSLSGRRAAVSALLAAIIMSALTGYIYLGMHRGDQHIRAETSAAVREAVTEGTTALLSYQSDTVDADLAAAETYLTGEFGSYYESFTRDVVAPAAKEQQIATNAKVVGAATVSVEEDHAVALVMVNQETSTAINPQANSTSTTIRVEVQRQDGEWRISKFDPV